MKTWERWTFTLEMLTSKRYHIFQQQLNVFNALWKKSAPCRLKVDMEKWSMKRNPTFLLSIHIPTSSILLAWLWMHRFSEAQQVSNPLKLNGILSLSPLNIYTPDMWMDNCFVLLCHLMCQEDLPKTLGEYSNEVPWHVCSDRLKGFFQDDTQEHPVQPSDPDRVSY